MTQLRNLPVHHRSRYAPTRRALAVLVLLGSLLPLLGAFALTAYANALFTTYV